MGVELPPMVDEDVPAPAAKKPKAKAKATGVAAIACEDDEESDQDEAWVMSIDVGATQAGRHRDSSLDTDLELDSAAGDHVCRRDFASDVPISAPADHLLYDVQGNLIPGYGRKTVKVKLADTNSEQFLAAIAFESAEVDKNVLSIAKLHDLDYLIVLQTALHGGSYMEHFHDGRVVPFRRNRRRSVLDYDRRPTTCKQAPDCCRLLSTSPSPRDS